MQTFSKGDVITSNVDAQGMQRGDCYLVQQRRVRFTPFGDFVTYVVRHVVDGKAAGEDMLVGNAHLLCERVEGWLSVGTATGIDRRRPCLCGGFYRAGGADKHSLECGTC